VHIPRLANDLVDMKLDFLAKLHLCNLGLVSPTLTFVIVAVVVVASEVLCSLNVSLIEDAINLLLNSLPIGIVATATADSTVAN